MDDHNFHTTWAYCAYVAYKKMKGARHFQTHKRVMHTGNNDVRSTNITWRLPRYIKCQRTSNQLASAEFNWHTITEKQTLITEVEKQDEKRCIGSVHKIK